MYISIPKTVLLQVIHKELCMEGCTCFLFCLFFVGLCQEHYPVRQITE